MADNRLYGIHYQVLALAMAVLIAEAAPAMVVVLPLFIESDLVSGWTFGLSRSMLIGVILSGPGVLTGFAQPILGRLSDRLGTRKVFLLLAMLVGVVINLGYTVIGTHVGILLLRTLGAIGVAGTPPIVTAMVNEYSNEDNRGVNMGAFNALRFIGSAIGPVVAGLLLRFGPYDLTVIGLSGSVNKFYAVFYLAAFSLLLAFLYVYVYVRDPVLSTSIGPGDLSFPVFSQRSGHLLHPIFAVSTMSFVFALNISQVVTLQPQINDHLNQGPFWFGVQFAAVILLNIVLQLPCGYACDRLGRRPFLLVGLALLIPSTLAHGWVTTPTGMLLARAAQGFAGALTFAPAIALAGDLTREGESGTNLSVLTLGFGAGLVAGPLFSGFLIRYGYTIPFVAGALLAVVSLIILQIEVEETLQENHTPSWLPGS